VLQRGVHDRATILALLEHGPRRLEELVTGAESYSQAVGGELRRLLADGLVERLARGVYALRVRSAAE
jgi:predicted transcriptional regulator